MGSYELSEAENVQRGTKIVIHLKGECYDYSKEDVIKGFFVFVLQVLPITLLVVSLDEEEMEEEQEEEIEDTWRKSERVGIRERKVGRRNGAEGTGEARGEIG